MVGCGCANLVSKNIISMAGSGKLLASQQCTFELEPSAGKVRGYVVLLFRGISREGFGDPTRAHALARIQITVLFLTILVDNRRAVGFSGTMIRRIIAQSFFSCLFMPDRFCTVLRKKYFSYCLPE
jgi:hypothetical protein